MSGRPFLRACIVAATIAGIAALGRAWYVRPIHDARRVGIDARQLWRHGRCASSQTEATCVTDAGPRADPSVWEQLSLDPWSRGVLRASRSWTMDDSARWSGTLDSLRRAAEAAGGHAIGCDVSGTGFSVSEAWRLDARELRLYGAVEHVTPPRRWFVSTQLVQAGAAGCGPSVTRRRASLKELDSMFGAWVRDHVEF